MAIDKNKIIEAATKFVQKGQYDKAIKEYAKLLDADPKDARIQQKLGELYQKKGDNLLAADCFLKVAESYAADGFFLKAVAVYKQVLKLNPTLVEVNLRLAELHQQLGLMSDAMAQFQLVANHYEKSGNLRASLDTLRKMVDLDPDNVASRIKLAELYARENMNAEALGEFQRAAEYLKRNNRVDDYVKVAERLVFLDPNNIELTRELANIYLTKQDTKRALAKLQLCFKADPKDVETLHMLAQAFKELGQVSKTVSVYKELAKIYDEQDRVDEERDVWKKVGELAPDDPDLRARQPQAPPQAPAPVAPAPARPQAAPAPARAPSSPPSQKASADQIPRLLTETDVYVKYGLHEKAIEHLKKVFAIDPESLDALEKAAELLGATGNHPGALDSLVRAVRVALGRGDLDRARLNLQKLCEKEPTHPEIPGFLNAVGGLGQVEEVAEIEEDAILVDAADEAIEVAPEPLAVDLSLAPVEEVAESLIEAEPDADDAALDAAAESLADEVVQDDVVQDEVLAEALGDGSEVLASHDDLGLADVESGSGEFLEPEPSFGNDEPLVADAYSDEPLIAEPPEEDLFAADEAGEPLEGPESPEAEVELVPTMPGRMSLAGARPPPEEDVHEDPTRVADLQGLLQQVQTQRPSLPSLADDDDEPTTVLPALRLPERALEKPPVARAKVPVAVPEPEPEPEVEPPVEPEPEEDPAGDELDEATFFLEQGMLEEAREIVETVMLAYPGSARAQELLGRLEAAEAPAEAPAAEPEPPADAAFDLASELANEDFGSLDVPATPSASEDFQYSVEDVFDEFKKGLKKVVKPEDVDTHYDLGIAYKEMGLVEDAIGEFEQAAAAAGGKKKEIEALAMVGICRMERGEWPQALEAFQRAGALPQATPDTAKAVHFEQGLVLEKMGRFSEALVQFEKVQKLDGSFRDVGSAVARMRDLGAEEEHTEPGAKPLKALGSNGAARPGTRPDSDEPNPPKGTDPKGKKARKIGFV